jgi:hypothetical protein
MWKGAALAELSDLHLKMLREESAISDAVIQARCYRTITDPADLRKLGFAPSQCRVPGLLLPLWTTDGANSLYVYRPDNPRVVRDRKTGQGRIIKYEVPKGAGTRLDCPPVCRPMLGDPSVRLWLVEGQKKADSLASQGLCAVALLGVWNFMGRNAAGGVTLLADFDYIALNGRDVVICFDSDVMTKREVQQALERLTEHLQRKGAHVGRVYLPANGDGKVGVDDYVAAGHTVQELEAMIEAPRPLPQAAPPQVRLLDDAPLVMRRPLALIEGRSYAAAWLWTETTVTERLDEKTGQVVRLNPPTVTRERRLFVIRDDGVIFGDGGDRPIDDLGIDVHLPEVVIDGKGWTAVGVKAYRAGQRPDPVDVFGRVADVVDRFIDFERSLAGQRTMAEMVAAYILATWLQDAFQVFGYLWPNGEPGSGKTQLLALVCELAYLGTMVQSGGTFAALRDLADYGATLGFDDAEALSDPRKSDPDKRTLLLAGNRRGSSVPMKEPAGDRTWVTRHVSTYCPRLFSAINVPDTVLASRSVVVPLVRTIDRQKANSDPLEYGRWPHDRKQLLSDLWALGLACLAELPAYDERVGAECALLGRALEPWRCMLAVAMWLQDRGAAGVFDRLHDLAQAYQQERRELEQVGMGRLVVQAIVNLAADAETGVADVSVVTGVTVVSPEGKAERQYQMTAGGITEAAKKVAEEEDADGDWINNRTVGKALSRLRIPTKRIGKQGARGRVVTVRDLQRLAQANAVELPDPLLQTPVTPVTPETSVGGTFDAGMFDPSHLNGGNVGGEQPTAEEPAGQGQPLPEACVICGVPTLLRGPDGRPLCSFCAERRGESTTQSQANTLPPGRYRGE